MNRYGVHSVFLAVLACVALANTASAMYHPQLGRFLNRDPIGYEAGDANLYRYVGDSPLNRVDPSGQEVTPTNPMPPSSGPGSLKPGGNPGDVGDDRDGECIFSCKGSLPPKSPPGGTYCPGITDPDDLVNQCQNLKDKKCSRITIDGHGTGGVGAACSEKGSKFGSDCFGCWPDGTPSKNFDEVLKCLKDHLAPGGYLRICSCSGRSKSGHEITDADKKCLANMKAALGGATVCFCNGQAWSKKGQFCHCDGEWVCN